jgi:3-oxoacyl-[acyl-carrier protein] reductase
MAEQFLSLEGKVAVVTGSARGIGRAIAEVFAQRGANVVITDKNAEMAANTAQEMSDKYGRKISSFSVDVSDSASVKALFDQVLAEYNRVDILVNNAGTTRDNLIMRMDEPDWDLVLNINLKGVFNCSKAVVRPMMKQRSGRIINISSVSGLAGQPGQANYSASKAGVIGLTKALARELGSRQITVNAVAPGFIPTDLTKDLPTELKEASLGSIPLGRWGNPEEIAYAVAFLASDQAAYITGHVLSVDGGMVMM